jgi:hypothetical protein
MRFPRELPEPGLCRPGRDIGGQGVELRIGSEHLADPLVKLVLGQPSLHERGLERAEHLLAIGLRRHQAVAVARACYLVSGLDHLGASYEDDLPKA